MAQASAPAAAVVVVSWATAALVGQAAGLSVLLGRTHSAAVGLRRVCHHHLCGAAVRAHLVAARWLRMVRDHHSGAAVAEMAAQLI